MDCQDPTLVPVSPVLLELEPAAMTLLASPDPAEATPKRLGTLAPPPAHASIAVLARLAILQRERIFVFSSQTHLQILYWDSCLCSHQPTAPD